MDPPDRSDSDKQKTSNRVRPKRGGKTKSDRWPSSSSPPTVQTEQVNSDSQPLNSSAKTAVLSTSTPASTRTPLSRTDGRAVDASPASSSTVTMPTFSALRREREKDDDGLISQKTQAAKSSKDQSTSAEKTANKDGPSKSSTEDNRAAGKKLAPSATATGTNRKIGTSPEVKGGTGSEPNQVRPTGPPPVGDAQKKPRAAMISSSRSAADAPKASEPTAPIVTRKRENIAMRPAAPVDPAQATNSDKWTRFLARHSRISLRATGREY